MVRPKHEERLMSPLSNRIVGITLAGILIYFPIRSIAGNATIFPSVEVMIDDFNDYSTSNGTFKVLAKDPLHIQLSPQIVQGELPEIIEFYVKRTLVYGIYRVFVHTPADRITVTAVPQEINFHTNDVRYVPGYKRTISITRTEALALIRKYLRVNSLSDLVTETKTGDMIFLNQWIKECNRLYYNDQGHPGLNRFVGELAR